MGCQSWSWLWLWQSCCDEWRRGDYGTDRNSRQEINAMDDSGHHGVDRGPVSQSVR